VLYSLFFVWLIDWFIQTHYVSNDWFIQTHYVSNDCRRWFV
jgi:hypothetical protein